MTSGPFKGDPKIRRQARGVYLCAMPLCGKPLTEVAVKNRDPFCSTACCRAFHGVEIQQPSRGFLVASSI